MRRLFVALSTLLLLASGLAPAHADSVTIQIKGEPEGDPEYFALTTAWRAGFGCEGVRLNILPPYLRIRSTDPAPPAGLGERSWGYQPQEGGNFYGIGVDVLSAGDLDTFGMQVYSTGGGADGRSALIAYPEEAPDGFFWLGMASVGGVNETWTYVDGSSLAYSWKEYDEATLEPTATPGVTATLAEWDADMGTTAGYSAFMGFGCDGKIFDYDGFRYGASGNVTTLDFERLTTSITIGATKKTIVAGKATRITGATSAQYFPDTDVDLEVKAFGSTEFVKVTTVGALPADDWKLAFDVKPLRQTTYRWRYLAGTGNNFVNDPATSAELVINVKTALTAKVADSTIKRGKDIVFSGKTRPTKPGTTVTLWRKTSTGASLLATTTVKADGTYKFAHRAGRKGTWKVYATIPATPGNLAGTSPVRTVSVS